MNLNIKQTDCKYYINEESRKVVCVIDDVRNLFFKYIRDFKIDIDAEEKFWNKLLMPARFVGIATCNENDTFDVELGKKIAFHKAKEKLNISFFKRAQTYLDRVNDELIKIIDNFNDFGEHISRNTEQREKIIRKLLDEKEVKPE